MPVNSRDFVKDSVLLADINQINTSLSGTGEPLALASTPFTLAKMYSELYGLRKILGEPNRRKGYGKFNGNDIVLTGTYSTSGTTVTGSGTLFTSQLAQGDFIKGDTGDYREVSSVISDTSAELYQAFDSDVPGGTPIERIQFFAERIGKISDFNTGSIDGRLEVYNATPKVLRLRRNNLYEVNGNILKYNGEVTLDFDAITNTFRNDGTTPIANISETQNRHLYVVLTPLGGLHAQIVPDSEMSGGLQTFPVNPILLQDFYAGSPTIFDPSKNGYYKAGKRIIATVRLNGTNEIEFVYELGKGHRYMDTQHLAVGSKFIETRYRREHPSCYVPDGSTVTNMSTEAPVLHRILGTNVLPDWRNRFGRNIDLAGARNLRDTQADAFQGHLLDVWASNLNLSAGINATGVTNATSSVDITSAQIIRNIISDGTNGTPRIANETRPMNYAELHQLVRG